MPKLVAARCLSCPMDVVTYGPLFSPGAAFNSRQFRYMLRDGHCPEGSIWWCEPGLGAKPGVWLWYAGRLWELDREWQLLEGGRVLRLNGNPWYPQLVEVQR